MPNILKSSQGLQIDIFYDVETINQGLATLHQATNVSFSLKGYLPTFTATSKITLILINRYFIGKIFTQQSVWEVQFTVADFYMDMVTYIAKISQSADMYQEFPVGPPVINCPQVAVVADNVWQQDPIQNGAHNFNFDWVT